MKSKSLSILLCLAVLTTTITFGTTSVFAVDTMANHQSYTVDTARLINWSGVGFSYSMTTDTNRWRSTDTSQTIYDGQIFSGAMDFMTEVNFNSNTDAQKAYFYFNYIDDNNYYRLSVGGTQPTNINASNPAATVFANNTITLDKVVGGVSSNLYTAPAAPVVEDSEDNAAQIEKEANNPRTTLQQNCRVWISVADDGKISARVTGTNNTLIKQLFTDVEDDTLPAGGKIGLGTLGAGIDLRYLIVTPETGTEYKLYPTTYGVSATCTGVMGLPSEWTTDNVSMIWDPNKFDNGEQRRWATPASGASSAVLNRVFTDTMEYSSYVVSSAGAGGELKFYFGYQDANNYYYVSFLGAAASATVTLYKVADGTPTQLDQYVDETNDPKAFRQNDHIQRIVHNGSTGAIGVLAATTNANPRVSTNLLKAVDTTFASGKVGFASQDAASNLRNVSVRAKRLGEYYETFDGKTINDITSIWNDTGAVKHSISSGRLVRGNGSNGTSNYSASTITLSYIPTGSYKLAFDANAGFGYADNSMTVNFSQNPLSPNNSDNYRLVMQVNGRAQSSVYFQRVQPSWTATNLTSTLGTANVPYTTYSWLYNNPVRWEIRHEIGGRVIVDATNLADGTKVRLWDVQDNGASTAGGPRPGSISFTGGYSNYWIDNVSLMEDDFMVMDAVVKSDTTILNSLQSAAGQTVTVSTRFSSNAPAKDYTGGAFFATLRDADGNLIQVATQDFELYWSVLCPAVNVTLDIPADADVVPYTITGYYLDGETAVPFISKINYGLKFTPPEPEA